MITPEKFVRAVLSSMRTSTGLLIQDSEFLSFLRSLSPEEIFCIGLRFDILVEAMMQERQTPTRAMMINACIYYYLGFQDGVKDQKEVNELKGIIQQ
jgi:hypothetical protein